MSGVEALEAIVLAGGAGTRLRDVLPPGMAKPIAPVNGKPFVAYVIALLYRRGVRRICLSLGYQAHRCLETLGRIQWPHDLMLVECVEPKPLGTGGAIRYTASFTNSDRLLVVNGDTMADIDYGQLVQFHIQKEASITLGLAHVDNSTRYGQVVVDANGKVVGFVEKTSAKKSDGAYINAGVYVVERRVLEMIPDGRAVSWEREVLEPNCGQDLFATQICTSFIDIGTPESYAQAAAFMGAHFPTLWLGQD